MLLITMITDLRSRLGSAPPSETSGDRNPNHQTSSTDGGLLFAAAHFGPVDASLDKRKLRLIRACSAQVGC